MKPEEIAKLLGVSKSTIYRYLQLGGDVTTPGATTEHPGTNTAQAGHDETGDVPMMHIQNVHQVSDAHSTVERAMEQLSHMLDERLVELDALFKKNGGTMWAVEAISHNVLAVPGESRRAGTGLFARPVAGPTLYVATAMLTVSHNNDDVSK